MTAAPAHAAPPPQQGTLSIDKSGPQSVFAGDTITWTLTITVAGGPSDSYEIHDPVPAGVTNVATTTGGCGVADLGSGDEVFCFLGSGGNPGFINPGQSFDVTVTALADGSTSTVTNVATVGRAGAPPSGSDDHVIDIDQVAGASLVNPAVGGLSALILLGSLVMWRRRRSASPLLEISGSVS